MDRLTATDRLFALANVFGEAMHKHLGASGLTPAKAELLLTLLRQGPLVQRRLSEQLRCTPRHVTGLVDALEGDTLVSRGTHPTDRRAIVVELTPSGTAEAERIEASRRDGAAWLFDGVAQRDLATFVRIADKIMTKLETR
jgi:DNA-binding MarR family transcriptional regulator